MQWVLGHHGRAAWRVFSSSHARVGVPLVQSRGFDHLERKRLQKGYFFELNEMRDSGGKVVASSQGLVPVQRARPFPSGVSATHVDPTLATRDLRDLVSSAPATVVGVYFRENAVAHLRSWTEPLSSKGARTMEVCCVESLLFRAGPLRSLVLRGLRANAKKRLQGKNLGTVESVACFGNLRDFQRDVGIENRLAAYCFLVDSSGNVRWRGSGEASDAEVRSLWGAAQALESEEAGARRR